MTIGCPSCGTLELIPPLGPRMRARCVTCRSTLEATGGRTIAAALALSLATFVLLLPAYLAPVMSVEVLGTERATRLGSGVVSMWREGWVITAVLTGLFGVVLPPLRFGALSLVLAFAQARRRPRWLGRVYRWVLWSDLWAMPDVFLVGFGIGYGRVAARLDAHVLPGGWCFVAAALLTMLTRATLDRRAVWRAIAPEREAPAGPAISCTACDLLMPLAAEGRPCPRCALRLRARKPDAVTRATALTLAALALILPANLYPMTVADRLGGEQSHRIIDGVADLFGAGFWAFGLVILCTSILIPAAKLLGMGWFIATVELGWTKRLRLKTRLYTIIDELGRWSMVDVFTVAIFTPLIQFDGLASAHPAPAAPAFALVVVFTMAASRTFDPRLMWDAAGGRPA